MSLLDALNSVLGGGAAQQGQVSDEQFNRITDHATPDQLGGALADTFRTDKTPAMGDMVAGLFGNSSSTQQAGMLNQVLSALGPAAAAALAGGVLGKIMSPGSSQITPAQASQMSPDQVRAVIGEAQQRQPALADQLGQFYANHSGLIKTIGGIGMAYMLTKMKDNMSNR